MSTAFHQTHSAKHKPLANLHETHIDEACELLAERISRIARAHSADSVVFVDSSLWLTVIVETSSACVQRQRKKPAEVVGTWRRADAATLKRAIEAHLAKQGLLIA